MGEQTSKPHHGNCGTCQLQCCVEKGFDATSPVVWINASSQAQDGIGRKHRQNHQSYANGGCLQASWSRESCTRSSAYDWSSEGPFRVAGEVRGEPRRRRADTKDRACHPCHLRQRTLRRRQRPPCQEGSYGVSPYADRGWRGL